jgi:hypothetical protein
MTGPTKSVALAQSQRERYLTEFKEFAYRGVEATLRLFRHLSEGA